MNGEHQFGEDEQREWEAQENARLATGDDALARRYRVVARSLEAMPRPSLRSDFAARVAKRVDAERREQFPLAPFERVVTIALAIAFAAAILVAAAMTDLLPALGDAVREARAATGARWLAVLALCVATAALPLSRTRRERESPITDSSGT
jgi:hypothetical protein